MWYQTSNLYYSIIIYHYDYWLGGWGAWFGDWFRSPAGPPSSCLVVRSVLSNIWVSVASLGRKRVEKMGSKWSLCCKCLKPFGGLWARWTGMFFEVFEQGRGFLWFLATNFPRLAHAKMYPQNHAIQGVAKSLAVLQFYGPNLWLQNVACGGSEVWQLSFGEVCCSAPGLPEVLCGSSDALHGLWDGQVPSALGCSPPWQFWNIWNRALLTTSPWGFHQASESETTGVGVLLLGWRMRTSWHMYIKVQPPKPISNAIILGKTRNRLRPWADSRW